MHLHRHGAEQPPQQDSTYPTAAQSGVQSPNGHREVATIIGELTQNGPTGGDLAHLQQSQQRSSRLISALSAALRRERGDRPYNARFMGRRLADEALAIAPRLPVRDQAALWRQFPGRSPDQVAEALIDNAARASAAIGAAVGVWALLPIAPLFAIEVAAETLAVAAIEIKLIAELHEVYGLPVQGTAVERMTAYTSAWADRRGVAIAPANLVLAVGPALRRRLARRMTRRATRSVLSLGPLLSGAAAGAMANRRETRRIGRMFRAELRRTVRGGKLRTN